MRRSHKARLFYISTLSVGTVLALLFTGIVLGVRHKVLAHKEAEMGLAVRTAPRDSHDSVSLPEFRKLYPGYTIAIYDGQKRLTSSVGDLPVEPVLGFVNHGSFVQLGMQEKEQHIVLSSGWTQAEHGLDDLAMILAALWLPLTLLVGAATWQGANSMFRPLDRLSQQAAAISGSNLKERLAIQDRAEFGAFATQLNQMLDRIEQTVAREEQFASDAAHELRTPLAILRTRVETTLLKDRNPEEYKVAYLAQLDELERLTLLVESLLRSARAPLAVAEAVDAEPLVNATLSRYTERFAEKQVRVNLRSQPARACILAEEFQIVLSNLLDNALRFTPQGGEVSIQLHPVGNAVELIVEDTGPGIPKELAEHAFDRFFRADDSRNRASGGAGIGLSVCKRILESRGGSIAIAPSDKGARLVCNIPS